jgi:hypothetical protein
MPFLNNFYDDLLKDRDSKLFIFGPQQVEIIPEILPDQIELFRSVEFFISRYLEELIFA